MTTGTMRRIVKIDEEKCNGCGSCAIKCAEGALQIIGGKARLINDQYCDGLGACLGECPQGAITIEERIAEDFSEEVVRHHHFSHEPSQERLPCGCPSTQVAQFERHGPGPGLEAHQPSRLRHWPVQLTLVPPKAPFLQNADLVLAADCVPFAYADFHQEFLPDRSLLVACPKLDNFQAHLRKLTDILSQSSIKSPTVVHMEVPCCSLLVQMARQAIRLSGKDIPLKEVTITVNGDVEK